MKRMVLAAALFIGACGTSTGPADLEGALRAEGLTVQRGETTTFVVEDCEALDQCFGNNRTTPYLLFNAPAGQAGVALPDSVVGAIPKVPEDMAPSYLMEEGDAIIVTGLTPPEVRYFGLTPYLFSRTDEDGERIPVFASLGDTLNHTNIQTATGDPFGARFALVLTSDAQTLGSVTTALVAYGTPPEAINTLVLPRDALRFGQDPQDDAVMLMGRIAVNTTLDSAGQAAQTAYLEAPPLNVLRVASNEVGPALPVPARSPRGDGVNELAFVDSLDALEDAILSDLSEAYSETVAIMPSNIIAGIINPESCITNVTECLGDNSDTTYAAGPIDVIRADGELTLGPDDYFIVYGVNHVATNKATHTNVNVYSKARRIGVTAVSDLESMGSAARYLPEHPDADKLFAFELRRDCGARPFCKEIATEFPGVPLDESLFFIFRTYMNPGLSVSPDHDEVLAERVIVVRDEPPQAPVEDPFALPPEHRPQGDEFMVVILPDTQIYAQSFPETFESQLKWVADYAEAYNIVFVSHVGDVVQTGSVTAQWDVARAAFDWIEDLDLPHGFSIAAHDISGNHSADVDTSCATFGDLDCGAKQFMSRFGPQQYIDRPWYVGASPTGLSSLQRVVVGELELLFLHLPQDTPTAEVDWAQEQLDAYPGALVHLTTHRYLFDYRLTDVLPAPLNLFPDGGRFDTTLYELGGQSLRYVDGIEADTLFTDFISANPNIWMVQCGHVDSEYRQASINSAGLPVYELLSDFQNMSDGGGGWLRLHTYSPSKNQVRVTTFSTLTGAIRANGDGFDHSIDILDDYQAFAADVLAAFNLNQEDIDSYLALLRTEGTPERQTFYDSLYAEGARDSQMILDVNFKAYMDASR